MANGFSQVSERFVPNDYYATEQYRFQVVTGPNMSGKSTYIRSVALLQIMAQVGSFVPADYAAFPIINKVFARVTTDDSIEANLSTFSVEMREMAFMLRYLFLLPPLEGTVMLIGGQKRRRA